jgi:ubiquitin C-terminal hydrolase
MGNGSSICESSNTNRYKKRQEAINRNVHNNAHNNNSFNDRNSFNKELIGFQNIGNSCYINSFLQILLHCPGFISELRSENSNENLINILISLKDDPENDFKYLNNIKNHMKNVNPEYGTFNQGDSQLFGKYLIDEVIKCLKGYKSFASDYDNINIREKEKKYGHFINLYQQNEIGLEKMFLINEIEYKYNFGKLIDITFNSIIDIGLAFPTNNGKIYSLIDLLELKYNNTNIIGKNNKGITKKICKLPKILIFTISRSILNQKFNESKLRYPETLNVKNYIEYIKNESFKEWNNTTYKLFAINDKIGNSQYSGHYVCYIIINKNWYLFNDKEVIQQKPNFTSENVVGLFYKESK